MLAEGKGTLFPKKKKVVLPKRKAPAKKKPYTDMFNPNAKLDSSRVTQVEYLGPPTKYDAARNALPFIANNYFSGIDPEKSEDLPFLDKLALLMQEGITGTAIPNVGNALEVVNRISKTKKLFGL
jgi:hypothetical protein